MTTAQGFETDLSQWPLVIWRMQRVLSVPEFEVYLKDADRILARRERYAQIVVSQLGSGKSALTPETRKVQAAWVKANFAALERHCAAMTVVLTDLSPMAHFTASFFMMVLGRMPSPSKICVSEAEAVAWAREQLLKRAS